ncbi:PQQ-binding-like beta-propeller repeat protein [Spirosoma panaciterrae]|uniref:outer membrane protein assembly factor BamB family protein n=1 Tax=Spirosoma panaciterrae TaxID=496058 RepID=UPI00036E7F8E|nr:PQQ-binding-like beta-propeller repeat protein [Spirosoma panaciterrae]
MKSSFPLLSTLFCLLLWGASCKKTEDTPTPGGGTTTSGTKSSAKSITAFAFNALSPAVTGTIDVTTKTISATVTNGTDVTKLVPTIMVSDKATVSPASGSVQDFSKAITYTVTAEDGSTQAYVMTVTVASAGTNSAVSSDQVIYFFISEGKTDNTTGKYSSIKSIVAIDALSGKSAGSFNLGTEIPNNSAPYISTYIPGTSGDGNTAYPRLYDNGLLYTFQTKKVNAIDAKTGAIKWSSTIDDYSSSGGEPVVDNGMLFVSGSKHIYALETATGKLKWDFSYTDRINTFTASNGLLYVGYGDVNYSGGLLAIDIATGKEKWTVKTIGVVTNPAVSNGVVYYGDAKNKVYAVDAATGTKKWEYLTGGMVQTSPTVSDGIVYIGSEDRKVYALDAATGSKKWEFTAAGTKSTYGGLIADADNLYFSAYNGSAFVINALDRKTGAKKWEATSSEESVPVVTNGILYYGQQAFDTATGANKNWGLKNLSSPCIVSKGKFFASSNSGMVQ